MQYIILCLLFFFHFLFSLCCVCCPPPLGLSTCVDIKDVEISVPTQFVNFGCWGGIAQPKVKLLAGRDGWPGCCAKSLSTLLLFLYLVFVTLKLSFWMWFPCIPFMVLLIYIFHFVASRNEYMITQYTFNDHSYTFTQLQHLPLRCHALMLITLFALSDKHARFT